MRITTDRLSFSFDGVGDAVRRIVLLFVVTGAGLAVATATFIGAIESPDLFWDLYAVGIVLTVSLGFTYLGGIVLASIGGVYAAGSCPDRSTALQAALFGCGLGHLAMTLTYLLFLTLGLSVAGITWDPVRLKGLAVPFLTAEVTAAVVGALSALIAYGRRAHSLNTPSRF